MITLFYKGVLYGHFTGWWEIYNAHLPMTVWMEAIAYDTRFGNRHWTNMAQESIKVPKELQAWELLL